MSCRWKQGGGNDPLSLSSSSPTAALPHSGDTSHTHSLAFQEGPLPPHTSFQGFMRHIYILKGKRHFAVGNPLGLPDKNVNTLHQGIGQEA